MDEIEIIEYAEIISYISSKCTDELNSNKKIKAELDFYNKYGLLEKFKRKFKCNNLFDDYEIDNYFYQRIIKMLCPKIDLNRINKNKKLKDFFEILVIFLVFFYLFSNELFIMYKYHKKLEHESITSIYKSQKSLIKNLTVDVENLNEMNTNIQESINNRTIALKISDLEKEISDQYSTVESLNLFLDNTITNYNNKISEISNVINYGNVFIPNVPIINQYPDYPSGCESIALLILLKYAHVEVTPYQLTTILKKAPQPYYVNNTRYGNDPESYFIGNPTDVYGYGVYERPIIEVASKFKSGIKNVTGSSLNEVLWIVMQGNPVQVWVAMDGVSTYYLYSWIDVLSGKVIYYPASFHSLVIIGFNGSQIITSDPSIGAIRYYDRYSFEQSYNFFGKRAIYYE